MDTPTTIRTAENTASSWRPIGHAVRPRRLSQPAVGAVLVGGGIVLGGLSSGTFGTGPGIWVVLVAAGLALYRPALGLAALAIISPLPLQVRLVGVSLGASPTLIAVLILGWLFRQAAGKRTWRPSPLDGSVLLFAGTTALSLAGLNPNLTDQLRGLSFALGGFAVFYLTTQSLSLRHDIWLLLAAVVVAGLSQAAVISIGVLTGSQVVSEQSRVAGTLVDPNHFAGWLVLMVPLLIAVGVAMESKWAVALTVLMVLVAAIALVATLSRSSWLGLLAGTATLLLLAPRNRLRIAFVVSTVGLVLLAAGLQAPIGARLAPHTLGPFEMLGSRWAVWSAAVSIAAQHPLFGVGLDNFHSFFAMTTGWLVPVNHAHNLFLNVAAERGLPGLAAFALVTVVMFRTLGSRVGSAAGMDRALLAGLIASFVAYFVHSMLEVSYYEFTVVVLFWLLAGVAASLPRFLAADIFDGVQS